MLLNCAIFHFIIFFLCVCPSCNAAIVAEKSVGCGAVGDCLSSPIDCQEKCGCDGAYYYNETTGECVLDIKQLMQELVTAYDIQDHHKYMEEGMAKKIRLEADKVFKGIIISVLLFITCATLCAFSACVYCIRMNYTDRVLKNDVNALAKKLHRDQTQKKSIVKPPREPKEESCNVVVQSSGLYVV